MNATTCAKGQVDGQDTTPAGLIRRFRRMAGSIANKLLASYPMTRNDWDDLDQELCLAILLAYGTWKPEKGTLVTHTYWRVMGAVGTWRRHRFRRSKKEPRLFSKLHETYTGGRCTKAMSGGRAPSHKLRPTRTTRDLPRSLSGQATEDRLEDMLSAVADPRTRRMYEMVLVDGLSVQEVAAHYGITKQRTSEKMREARPALREHLSDYDPLA